MAELIISADVEGAAVTFLRDGLTAHGITATVATKVPKVMPGTMVKLSLTGGNRENIITDRPQLTVEVWANSTTEASHVARLCHGLMHSAAGTVAGEVWVRRVDEVGGVKSFPDPDHGSSKPRYQFTVRWFVRGIPA